MRESNRGGVGCGSVSIVLLVLRASAASLKAPLDGCEQATRANAEQVGEHISCNNLFLSSVQIPQARLQELTLKMMKAMTMPIFRQRCEYKMLKLLERYWSVVRYGQYAHASVALGSARYPPATLMKGCRYAVQL